MSELPPFNPKGSPYDLDTYWGRVRHFWRLVNPLSVLTPSDVLAADKSLITAAKAGSIDDTPENRRKLWDAKFRVDAVHHPDTGDAIPAVFRMAMFMPVNLPISAGMLLSPPGMAQLFWQWANQSYNAGFNFANRNASLPVDMKSVGISYAVATSTALLAAHFLGKVVTNMQSQVGPNASSLKVKLLSRGLPWFAVATAGSANVLAMRYKEAITGVTVEDEHGNPQGTSIAAGRLGLAQITLTRVILPIPILLIPPFILDALRSTKSLGAAMARSRGVRVGVELGIIAVFLQCALPLAIACFPQRTSLPAASLEPEFSGRIDSLTGKPIERYFFNKGV